MDQKVAIQTNIFNAIAIDGDTIKCTLQIYLTDFGVSVAIDEQRVRLLGINTPERGQDGYLEAKERLQQLLDESEVIRFSLDDDKKRDSFGRWLATLWRDYELNDGSENLIDINEIMLDEKLAVPYAK